MVSTSKSNSSITSKLAPVSNPLTNLVSGIKGAEKQVEKVTEKIVKPILTKPKLSLPLKTKTLEEIVFGPSKKPTLKYATKNEYHKAVLKAHPIQNCKTQTERFALFKLLDDYSHVQKATDQQKTKTLPTLTFFN